MTNQIFPNFSSGEGSDKIKGRSDLPVYKSLLEWCENFIVYPQGPASYRPGTRYIHNTRRNKVAVFVPFFFSDQQAYLVEATEGYFRFYKESGIIVLPSVTITNISQANPAVVTATGHGYSDGDEVVISGVTGMTQVNGRSFVVEDTTTNTFTLRAADGTTLINSTGYDAYVSGGVAKKVYEITTPYSEADLPYLQSAQSADTRYIVVRTQAPRKLVRFGETNWTLSTFIRTSDPFGSGNWPGAVAFTADSALIYGGSNLHPETIWKSNLPTSSGNPDYDNFTTGTLSTNSIVRTLASLHGKVDSIRWISNTTRTMIVGCYGSIRRLYGAREELSFTVTDTNARPVDFQGVAPINPYPNGSQLLYVQRGGYSLQSVEYDYTIDGYRSLDKNLIADHILNQGIKKIANNTGNPEILWCLRTDGVLAGLTYNDKENKYGWHRHTIGGGDGTSSPVISWIETLPREQNRDVLFCVVERVIDGAQVRYVEALTDTPRYPERNAFFIPNGDAGADERRYENVLFEAQKTAVHADCAAWYDGSALGLGAGVTLTIGAGYGTTGTANVTVTASTNIFSASMVGRQLWGRYTQAGNGGGRIRIDDYDSPTQIRGTVLSGFDFNSYAPGNWFLTTDHISGLWHVEGGTVAVIKDGSVHPDRIVDAGEISLQSQASYVVVGLKYKGVLITMPIDQGGLSGPAISKRKIFKHFGLHVSNSGAFQVGSTPNRLEPVSFRSSGDITGRPVPLHSGIVRKSYGDSHERLKKICIVQTDPLPCTIIAMEPYGVTTEE